MQITWGGILFIVIIILVIVGIIFFNKWRKGESMSLRMPRFGKGDHGRQSLPNSMNIYPNKIEFEYVKKPMGMPGKCYNDGQEYFIHRVDASGNIQEWILPDDDDDERYYNPGEFANVVEMPACKKYLEWIPNTFQKVAFGLMVVVIAAELITLIILSG